MKRHGPVSAGIAGTADAKRAHTSLDHDAIALRLQHFIAVNNLDERCVGTLRELTPAQQNHIMNQEFVVQIDPKKGSTSALVVGRCKQARMTPVEHSPEAALSLAEFIAVNGLDLRCAETLRGLTEEQLQWVMAQQFVVQVDPNRGSASALVVGRCRKAKELHPSMLSSQMASSIAVPATSSSAAVPAVQGAGGELQLQFEAPPALNGAAGSLQTQLELFISVNALDDGCVRLLRELSEDQLQWVMAQEFVVQADPTKGSASALVVGRCKKAKTVDVTQQVQTSMQTQSLLQQFIQVNALDERCAALLRELSEEQLKWVMEQEFVLQVDPSKGSASALVVGRIKKVKAIDLTGSQNGSHGTVGPAPEYHHAIYNALMPHQNLVGTQVSIVGNAMEASSGFTGGSVLDGTTGQVQSQLQLFASINGLDSRCTAMLKELTPEQLQWVLDQELVVQVDPSRGNASALVVGRCKKAKTIDFTRLKAANGVDVLQGAAGHFQSRLALFIAQNNLDDRCAGILRAMPEDQASWVMDQEFTVRVDPSRGSASALVVGRCKRAGALSSTGVSLAPPVNISTGIALLDPHDQRLQQFIAVNFLDERCAATLRSLSQPQSAWIMDQEFVVNVDPARGNASALVVGRCNKAKAVAMTSADSLASHALRLQQFITLNNLDDGCAALLQSLTETQAKLVMDQEFHVRVDPTRGSASALVVGRCNSVRPLAPTVLPSTLLGLPQAFLA